MSDPRSLANSDSAALRHTLLDNRHRYILIRVIVVYDQDRLGNQYITFDVNQVLGRYDAIGANGAIVLNHNRWLTGGVVGGRVEPRALSQGYPITKTDSTRPFSTYVTHKMKIQIASS